MDFDPSRLQHFISVITIPIYFAVAWAFYRRRLWRSYLYFWLMLLVEGATMIASHLAVGNRSATRLIYLISQPPIWILYILMVMEVFRKVFVNYPGISVFAQRTLMVLMFCAFLFSLTSIGGDFSVGWTGQSLISRYSVIFRTVSTAICLFMIFVLAFLVWMPVPLPVNTIRHSVLLFFYFLVTTSVYYVMNTANQRSDYLKWANLVISTITVLALASWAFLLRPPGEDPPTIGGFSGPSPGDLLDRLESVADSLRQSGKKGDL